MSERTIPTKAGEWWTVKIRDGEWQIHRTYALGNVIRCNGFPVDHPSWTWGEEIRIADDGSVGRVEERQIPAPIAKTDENRRALLTALYGFNCDGPTLYAYRATADRVIDTANALRGTTPRVVLLAKDDATRAKMRVGFWGEDVPQGFQASKWDGVIDAVNAILSSQSTDEVARLQAEVERLGKDRDDWKLEYEMVIGAWKRELDGLIVSKTHLIDALVVTTRNLRTQLAARTSGDAPRIVCLCGSTRFMDQFHEQNRILTEQGVIVLSVGLVNTSSVYSRSESLTPEMKAKVDQLHLRKIELADEVLVLNVGGYVGESTKNEIAHATKLGKPIRYLEPFDTPAPPAAEAKGIDLEAFAKRLRDLANNFCATDMAASVTLADIIADIARAVAREEMKGGQ